MEQDDDDDSGKSLCELTQTIISLGYVTFNIDL